MKVSDVIFRDDLYPRIETSATTVQKYAEDLSVLPPIVVIEPNIQPPTTSDFSRVRIITEPFNSDGIRPSKILAAREAIRRGGYDGSDVLDYSLDAMVDRAYHEEQLEEARQQLMDAEWQRMTETDR